MRHRHSLLGLMIVCLLEPLGGPRDPDSFTVSQPDGKTCTIQESIISKVYANADRSVYLVDAYSGSQQWSRVYRAKDCKAISPRIYYAEYEEKDQTLRRRPFCYEGKCHSGKIYLLNDQCVPVLDPEASKAFTREVLGEKADTTKFKD